MRVGTGLTWEVRAESRSGMEAVAVDMEQSRLRGRSGAPKIESKGFGMDGMLQMRKRGMKDES